MNKVKALILLAAVPLFLSAQTYTFESDYTNWTAQQGTLAITGDHYKQGTHSLSWTTSGTKSVLLVKGFTQYSTSNSKSCFMQIYLPEATQDTLLIEFMNGTSVMRSARFVCNYSGWREFSRAYTEYASTATVSISAIRMTLRPVDATATRTICFDDVDLNKTSDASRVPGTQWLLDASYFKVNTTPLQLFSYTDYLDIPLAEPTADELTDLQTIRTRLMPTPGYNAPQAILAKNWVVSNISVVRNADGTLLKGTVLNTSAAALTEDSLVVIGQRLQYLAGGKLNSTNAAVGQAFDDYLDDLLDQGLGEGCNVIFASNSYTAPRTVIPYFVNIIPACNDRQREAVCRLVQWMSFYYMTCYPEEIYLANNVSDVLYLFLIHMETAAAFHPDDAVAVRELKAVQRFLNRNADYVPGAPDMLKHDGTGFHHNSHYNNYMYAYETYCTGIWNFRDTHFEISETAYEHFGRAILSIYTMASPGTTDARYYANSLCGRNPFNSGNNIFFTKSYFQQLIQSGNSYPEMQMRLKSAYNHFYQCSTYTDVPEVDYDGCWQFNYSPCGVVRHGSWVATMRAPTGKFWGAEIYSKENRFGRYQSHGSLEVMYQGGSLAFSGYPTNGTGGGWDWNVIPGTTTVHYTDWTEMMPKKSQTQRFDQYSGGTNFVGALADGKYGVFAANLSQTDKYGSTSCFTATNLTAHKSVFTFDSIMVALGSDISTSGSYGDDRITATNLFQSIISSNVGDMSVNGTAVTSAYDQTLPRTTANWIVAPTGTGYYLPSSNDAVQVIYGTQTTPKETSDDYASPTTTLTAAKAYINHGSKCSSRSYEFAVVPATDATRMAAMATEMQAGNVYHVLAQTSTLHAVSMDSVTEYAFYSNVDNISFGIVRSTTHQHLLVDALDAEGHHHFAACNPNLEPATDATYKWVASSTSTVLTLEGEWKAEKDTDCVTFAWPGDGTTTVSITFSEGDPVYFTAIPKTEEVALRNTESAGVQIVRVGDVARVIFAGTQVPEVSLYSAAGQLLSTVSVPAGAGQVDLPLAGLPMGVYVCSAGACQQKIIK